MLNNDIEKINNQRKIKCLKYDYMKFLEFILNCKTT